MWEERCDGCPLWRAVEFVGLGADVGGGLDVDVEVDVYVIDARDELLLPSRRER